MGSGCTKTCPKCGFEFYSSTGVGFMFPKVYAETIKKAKDGELGTVLQNFFKDHVDGALDVEYVNLCCEKCGQLDVGMDLTMYIHKRKKPEKIEHGRWSVAAPFEGAEYVSWSDLERYYDEYAKYPHKCVKCGGNMKILKDDAEMLCPECKVPLETTNFIMWD